MPPVIYALDIGIPERQALAGPESVAPETTGSRSSGCIRDGYIAGGALGCEEVGVDFVDAPVPAHLVETIVRVDRVGIGRKAK